MVTPSIFSNGTGFPCPSRVMSRQSRIQGPAAETGNGVSDARSAEKSSRPQPEPMSACMFVDAAVGLRNAMVGAPFPGIVPFDTSSR